MAEGNSTFKGLAVPLQGESEITQITAATDMITLTGASSQQGDFMVMQSSAGTERVWINADGCIYSRGVNELGGTAYLGLDARGTVPAAGTGTFYAIVGARLTTTLAVGAGSQQYALYGGVYQTVADGGGRCHPLCLYYNTTDVNTATGTGSFIYFVEANCPIPYFITVAGMTADESGGCLVTTNQSASLGLKIAVGSTDYYILLGATS